MLNGILYVISVFICYSVALIVENEQRLFDANRMSENLHFDFQDLLLKKMLND